MTAYRIVASDLQFPEGPVAMPDGSVILVETRRQTLTRIAPDGHATIIASLPGGPNGAAMGPDGKIYVCNNGGMGWHRLGGEWQARSPTPSEYVGGSLQRVDIQTGAVETLFTKCGETTLKAPNDLVFDREGGLWFTDFGKFRARDMDFGGVYYLDPTGGALTESVFPMYQPNGIGLSADERKLYVAETLTARIWSFELPRPGCVEPVKAPQRNEKGTLVATLPGYQMFDSLAIEACGNICLATMLTGRVSTVSPSGELIGQMEVGDPGVTNIAFGGPDLKTAYITLGRKGQLIAVDWPRSGLPLNFRQR